MFRQHARAVRLALLTTHAVAAAACAHGGPAGPARPATIAATDSNATGAPRDRVVLQVENRSGFDVIIYAVRGTLRLRIGSVAAVSRATIKIPDTFTSDLGGLAVAAVRLAGSESYLSESVVPHAGERLVLTVQPRVVDSSLSVQ